MGQRKEKAGPGYGGRDVGCDNRAELGAQSRKVRWRPDQGRGGEDHRRPGERQQDDQEKI